MQSEDGEETPRKNETRNEEQEEVTRGEEDEEEETFGTPLVERGKRANSFTAGEGSARRRGRPRKGAEYTRDISEFLNRNSSKRKILESPEGNKDLRKKKCEEEEKQEEGKNKKKEEEETVEDLLRESENRKKLNRSPRKDRIVQAERENPVTAQEIDAPNEEWGEKTELNSEKERSEGEREMEENLMEKIMVKLRESRREREEIRKERQEAQALIRKVDKRGNGEEDAGHGGKDQRINREDRRKR